MAKYNVGDKFSHKIFGECEVIEVDEIEDVYLVKIQDGGERTLRIPFVDKISEPPHFANVVAGQYKRKDGTFGGKEYFYKDRSNDNLGGLEVGDIALAYIKKIGRCIPFKITRINISKEELAEAGISRTDLTCLRYVGSEDYTKEE